MSTLNIPLFHRRSKKTSLKYPHLPADLVLILTLNDSNYTCLEQIFMVPQMFEPFKLNCTCMSTYKINDLFLILPQKLMLWVLIRCASKEALLMSIHIFMFSWRNKKNIYLIPTFTQTYLDL